MRVSVVVAAVGASRKKTQAVYATVEAMAGRGEERRSWCAVSGDSSGRGVVLQDAELASALHVARQDGSRSGRAARALRTRLLTVPCAAAAERLARVLKLWLRRGSGLGLSLMIHLCSLGPFFLPKNARG